MLGRSSGNHDWLLANASACVFAVSVYVTHATQAIAFEWKPGFSPETFAYRTYSRYERRIKGVFGEPKQYARFANSRVSDQQQLEQIIVCFCHRQLIRITPQQQISSILIGKLKRMSRLRPLQQ